MGKVKLRLSVSGLEIPEQEFKLTTTSIKLIFPGIPDTAKKQFGKISGRNFL